MYNIFSLIYVRKAVIEDYPPDQFRVDHGHEFIWHFFVLECIADFRKNTQHDPHCQTKSKKVKKDLYSQFFLINFFASVATEFTKRWIPRLWINMICKFHQCNFACGDWTFTFNFKGFFFGILFTLHAYHYVTWLAIWEQPSGCCHVVNKWLVFRNLQSLLFVMFQNLRIDWFWVEVNARINYPIKNTLRDMEGRGAIDMEIQDTKFYVSTVTLKVKYWCLFGIVFNSPSARQRPFSLGVVWGMCHFEV